MSLRCLASECEEELMNCPLLHLLYLTSPRCPASGKINYNYSSFRGPKNIFTTWQARGHRSDGCRDERGRREGGRGEVLEVILV